MLGCLGLALSLLYFSFGLAPSFGIFVLGRCDGSFADGEHPLENHVLNRSAQTGGLPMDCFSFASD